MTPPARSCSTPTPASSTPSRHLFATFARTGSARAVVQTFAAEGLRFPLRVRTGPHKGELAWIPLRHWRVLRTLHNPRYAGAFVYRPAPLASRPRRQDHAWNVQPRDQWTALIPDAHPGYISWDSLRDQPDTSCSPTPKPTAPTATAGPAREGAALLQGLAICGRCGRRMTVRYHHPPRRRGPRLPCMAASISAGVAPCLQVPGAGDRRRHRPRSCSTPSPPSPSRSPSASKPRLEARADEADALRHSHVERARHHAELARRRYLAVDPDNRLVADTLEADWNDALRQLRRRPRRLRTSRPSRQPPSPTSTRPNPGAGHRLPRPVVRPGHPAAGTQTHGPPAHRRRHHRPGPTSSTSTSASKAARPPASPSPSRPPAGKPARPTPTPSPASTGSSTPHRRRGRRHASTRPVTTPAPASPSPPASCLHSTPQQSSSQPAPTGSAPPACSPSPNRRARSACTHPPSRPGTEPACSPATRPTTRTPGSSTRPPPATPASSNAKAAASNNEFPPNQHQEVQYETIPLSQH